MAYIATSYINTPWSFTCQYRNTRLAFLSNDNCRLPTLPTWQVLLAARLLSTLPPSWASWCHITQSFFKTCLLSMQRRGSPWCQWPSSANYLWGVHPAHRQLQQLLHEQLHTSSENNFQLKRYRICQIISSSIQFNYYLTRGCQTNPFQLKLLSDWLQADKLFWR